MSNPNGVLLLLPFLFFLVSATSLFSPKWAASGSPTGDPNFKRPDPLRHFHYYNGAYDVRNKHYWVVSSNAILSLSIFFLSLLWGRGQDPLTYLTFQIMGPIFPRQRIDIRYDRCPLSLEDVVSEKRGRCEKIWGKENGIDLLCFSHFFQSAAFTGVHGYAIAGVWLLCGLGFAIFVAIKKPSSSAWPFLKHLDHHYFLMFLLVLLFTFLAV